MEKAFKVYGIVLYYIYATQPKPKDDLRPKTYWPLKKNENIPHFMNFFGMYVLIFTQQHAGGTSDISLNINSPLLAASPASHKKH